MEGKEVDIKKKIPYSKPPKGKLSGSFALRSDEQNYVYEEEDSQANNVLANENFGEISNHPIHIKSGSLQPSEITASQFNQALGIEYESKSATLKDHSDPFYQLYKEGNLNRRNSGETLGQNLSPSKIHNATLSSAGKYQHIESRYMSKPNDSSKSPQSKWLVVCT